LYYESQARSSYQRLPHPFLFQANVYAVSFLSKRAKHVLSVPEKKSFGLGSVSTIASKSYMSPPGIAVAQVKSVKATLNISEMMMLVLPIQDLKSVGYNSTVYRGNLIRVKLCSQANK
jgi:hypothetical protein